MSPDCACVHVYIRRVRAQLAGAKAKSRGGREREREKKSAIDCRINLLAAAAAALCIPHLVCLRVCAVSATRAGRQPSRRQKPMIAVPVSVYYCARAVEKNEAKVFGLYEYSVCNIMYR